MYLSKKSIMLKKYLQYQHFFSFFVEKVFCLICGENVTRINKAAATRWLSAAEPIALNMAPVLSRYKVKLIKKALYLSNDS